MQAITMKQFLAILLSLCALSTACAQSGTVTYNLTLTGTRTRHDLRSRLCGFTVHWYQDLNLLEQDSLVHVVPEALSTLLIACACVMLQ